LRQRLGQVRRPVGVDVYVDGGPVLLGADREGNVLEALHAEIGADGALVVGVPLVDAEDLHGAADLGLDAGGGPGRPGDDNQLAGGDLVAAVVEDVPLVAGVGGDVVLEGEDVTGVDGVAGIEETAGRGAVGGVAVAEDLRGALGGVRYVGLEAVLPVVEVDDGGVEGGGDGDDGMDLVHLAQGVVEGEAPSADLLLREGDEEVLNGRRPGEGGESARQEK
jgi:hypothetical protein